MRMNKLYFTPLLVTLFITFLGADSTYSEVVKTKKIYPMGEKIYNKKCSSISLKQYENFKQLSDAISSENLCKINSKKQIEAVSLYLWEVKRKEHTVKVKEMHVHKDERCPVCGMFVANFPKWAAQLFYQDMHYSFDGVKDLMKYYMKHQKGITQILVRDYYTQKVIDGFKAYYVAGSDVYGPMGNELIPFADERSAKTFLIDHKGKEVLEFKQITAEIIDNL